MSDFKSKWSITSHYFDLNSMYLDYYDNLLAKQNSLISDNKKLESQITALQEEIDH